jgi:hypothetical protein
MLHNIIQGWQNHLSVPLGLSNGFCRQVKIFTEFKNTIKTSKKILKINGTSKSESNFADPHVLYLFII